MHKEILVGNQRVVEIMKNAGSEQPYQIFNSARRVANLFQIDNFRSLRDRVPDILWELDQTHGKKVKTEDVEEVLRFQNELAYHALQYFERRLFSLNERPLWEAARAHFERMVLNYWRADPNLSPVVNMERLRRYAEANIRVCRTAGLSGYTRVPEIMISQFAQVDYSSGEASSFENSLLFSRGDQTYQTVADTEAIIELFATISKLPTDHQLVIGHLAHGTTELELAESGFTTEAIAQARASLRKLMTEDEEDFQDTSCELNSESVAKSLRAWGDLVKDMSMETLFGLIEQLETREKLAILKHTRYYLPELSTRRFVKLSRRSFSTFMTEFNQAVASVRRQLSDTAAVSRQASIDVARRIIRDIQLCKPIYDNGSQLNISDQRSRVAYLDGARRSEALENLAPSEQAIALLLWEFDDLEDRLQIRYSFDEIAKILNVSRSKVAETNLKIREWFESGEKVYIWENGERVKNDTLQYWLLKNKRRFTQFHAASLTALERQLVAQLTTPSITGRYLNLRQLEEENSGVVLSNTSKLREKLSTEPSKALRVFGQARRLLNTTSHGRDQKFIGTMVLKRIIGYGQPMHMNLAALASRHGISAEYLQDLASAFSKVEDGGIVFGESHYGWRGMQEYDPLFVVCDVPEYYRFVRNYPDLKSSYRKILVRLDQLSESGYSDTSKVQIFDGVWGTEIEISPRPLLDQTLKSAKQVLLMT